VSAPKYFFDLGSRAAVAHALSRLVKGNKLKRIAGGLYEYPRTKPILGELSPDLNKVAAALAGREGIRLQATGNHQLVRIDLKPVCMLA
jgi:hypothetical protein